MSRATPIEHATAEGRATELLDAVKGKLGVIPNTTRAAAGSQSTPRAAFLRAVGYGGLVSGVLDATDAVVAFGLLGMNPVQVLQFVASGAFGAAAFEGGLLTAAAGAGFHFLIAFVAAAVYAAAAESLPVLRRNWAVAGLLYGAWVWAFMNLIVLPMTSVVPGPTGIALTLNGVIGHALFVGLPIAYFARRLGRETNTECKA